MFVTFWWYLKVATIAIATLYLFSTNNQLPHLNKRDVLGHQISRSLRKDEQQQQPQWRQSPHRG